MEIQNEEVEKVTTRSVGLRYGLFLGAFSIVSFLTYSLTGVNMNEGPGAWANRLLGTAASILVLALAHGYFKKNGDGYMSLGQGMGIGFWATATSTLLTSFFMYIYIKFIDTGFVDAIKEAQIQKMQEQGMSDQQIDQAMKIASMFMSAEAILFMGIFFGILFGLLIALIVSLFTQKKNPDAIPS